MAVKTKIDEHPVILTIRADYIHRRQGAWFGTTKVQQVLQQEDIGYRVRGAALRLAAQYGQKETVSVLIKDWDQERKILSPDMLESMRSAAEKEHWEIVALIAECIQVRYPWLFFSG